MNEETSKQKTELDLSRELGIAASRNDLDAMQKAIEEGASPNKSDRYGYTPLRRAALAGHEAAIRFLLEKGADIRGGARVSGDASYLHDAARAGSLEAVVLLLDAGLSPDETQRYNWTPLMCAASPPSVKTYQGCAAVVAELLKRGANANAKDTYGNTPLHLAAASAFMDAVTLLLAAGADPNTADLEGKTSLFHALVPHVCRARHAEVMVESLLKAGATVNVATRREKTTPLHIAAACSSASVIRTLIQSGANIHAADTAKRTPVWEAIESAENFEVLLSAGADITPLVKSTGKPALISAAEKRNAVAVKALLGAGSDPNKIYRGKTALHLAVAKAHADVVAALLAAGADHLIADKDGVTALELARKRRRKAILPLLEAAEAARVARNLP